MKAAKWKGNALLVLTALIWGCAFVAQSVSMDHIGPFTFQAVRSFLGSAFLVPVFLVLDAGKKRAGNYHKPTAQQRRTLWVGGIACGVVMTVAANLQQVGIQYTTAGKAGFITAMYILFVPLLGLFLKKRVSPKLWGCIFLAAVGLYLLSVTEGFSSVGKGDFYVLLCAVAFAVHIVVVDYYAPLVDGARLSCIQFLVCGILSGVLTALFEQFSLQAVWSAAVPVLYAGILSCGVGYTLQIVGQKYTSPTVASLLLSLESVFAVLAGILLLGEVPTLRETAGCVLMFAAIVGAQLPERKKQTA